MNNNISQEKLNEIRNSVDIVDVISSYISLIPKGKNLFGICPFHDDNSPSMSVSKDKQIYKCFSCGAKGNVFKFIEDYENISFIEAVKKCADLGGVELDLHFKSLVKDSNKYSALYDVYEDSLKFYHNILNTASGKEAREYLNKRSINDEIIKEFKIGLSLQDRSLLTKFLTKKGVTKENLIKSGLVIDNNYGLNDIYMDRIMFPLEDLQGRVVGFSGRIYNRKDTSKYINTKETEIFKKGELIYNYARSKEEVRNKGYVIVMEGFMDVIRAYTVGIKNCVAMMGTAVTKNQANILKKMAKEIYLCFDGDEAGAHATFSCIDELAKVGVIPKVIRLEENLDPDEYILKYGYDKFKEKIDNPINVMDFKLSYLKENKDISKSEELAKYVNNVIKELSKVNDDILKEITLKKLSIESGLDIDFLKERITEKEEPKEEIKKEVKDDKKLKGYEKAERNLVYYMLNSKGVIKIYNNRSVFLSNPKLRRLANEISAYYHKYGEISLADFLSYIESYPELNETTSEILDLNLSDEVDLKVIDDYIVTIKDNLFEMQIKKLQDEIKKITDIEKQKELASKIADLKIQKENM